MRTTVLVLGVLALGGCVVPATPPTGSRVFVADEESGTISVIDHATDTRIASIDLSDTHEGATRRFSPHNVQAAPDGQSVWVVAPAVAGDPHGGHGGGAEPIEQAIVIDPQTLEIRARIDLGTGLHVAHVVLDSESRYAYVTANEANAVLRIDAQSFEVVDRFELGDARAPHGLRFCEGRLYVANMDGLSMSVIHPDSGRIDEVPLGGVAVQTACVPGGQYAFASLFDTMEVVRYELATGELMRIALPEGSQGPVQLYPTPDGSRIYVCDQGILLDRPASNRLVEIDVESATVTATIEVGQGAHGVVLSEDGTRAFVTNIADRSVSVVDTAEHRVVATVEVGDKPNGIAHRPRLGPRAPSSARLRRSPTFLEAYPFASSTRSPAMRRWITCSATSRSRARRAVKACRSARSISPA